MTPAIPVSSLLSSTPSVLSAGGNPLSPNAVFLTSDPSIPPGTVQAFSSAAAVSAWFGPNANETALANLYFTGNTLAQTLPSVLYFAQYNTAAVAGYLRGGSFGSTAFSASGITGLSGILTVSIDGVSHVTGSINLSAATGYSNAAGIIQTALQAGTPSTTATVTYDTLRNAFVITSSTTGATSAVLFPATDSLVTGLQLTAATGAVQSAGSAAGVPATIMNNVVAQQQNWVTFTTVFDPDAGAEPPTNKLALASWVTSASPAGKERFAYIAWDSDTSIYNGTAAGSFGALIAAGNYTGVCPIADTASGAIAAFICGTTACLNTSQENGRISYAYKQSALLTPQVTSATVAANLKTNGYNWYGQYNEASNSFNWFQQGTVSGAWDFLDEYINQILMNSDFRLALAEYQTSANSTPYNAQGYATIRSVLKDPIDKYLAFGAIQPNVPLTQSQAAQVNTAAGVKIDSVLSTVGWYLQILPASGTARQNRTSPPMTFWYTDGGSIQSINMAAIDVQ